MKNELLETNLYWMAFVVAGCRAEETLSFSLRIASQANIDLGYMTPGDRDDQYWFVCFPKVLEHQLRKLASRHTFTTVCAQQLLSDEAHRPRKIHSSLKDFLFYFPCVSLKRARQHLHTGQQQPTLLGGFETEQRKLCHVYNTAWSGTWNKSNLWMKSNLTLFFLYLTQGFIFIWFVCSFTFCHFQWLFYCRRRNVDKLVFFFISSVWNQTEGWCIFVVVTFVPRNFIFCIYRKPDPFCMILASQTIPLERQQSRQLTF